jgi:chromosome segregation ATPase
MSEAVSALETERIHAAETAAELERRHDELEEAERKAAAAATAHRDAERHAESLAQHQLQLARDAKAAHTRATEAERRAEAAEAAANEMSERCAEIVKSATMETEASRTAAQRAEDAFKTRLAEAVAAATAARDDSAAATTAQADLRAATVAAESRANASEHAREAAEEMSRRLRLEVLELKSEIASRKDELLSETSKLNEARQRCADASARVEKLEQDLLVATQSTSAANVRADAAETRCVALQSRAEAAEAREKGAAEKAQRQVDDLRQALTDTRAQLVAVNADRERAVGELAGATHVAERLRVERDAAASQSMQHADAVRCGYEASTRLLEERIAKLAQAETRAVKLESEVADVRGKLAAAEQRLEQLKASLVGAEKQREMTLESLRYGQDEHGKAIADEVKRLKSIVDGSHDNMADVEVTATQSGVATLPDSVAKVRLSLSEGSDSACKLDAMVVKLLDQHRDEVSAVNAKAASAREEAERLRVTVKATEAKRDELATKLAAATEEASSLRQTVETKTSESDSHERTIEHLMAKVACSEMQLANARTMLNSAQKVSEESGKAVKKYEESVEQVGRDLGRNLAMLANAEARCAELEKDVEQLTSANVELEKAMADKSDTARAAEAADARVAEQQARLAEADAELLAKGQAVARAEEAAAMAKTEMERKRIECERLAKTLEETRNAGSRETQRLRDAVDAKQEVVATYAKHLDEARTAQFEARKEADAAQAECQAAVERCRVLEDTAAKCEGQRQAAVQKAARLQRVVTLAGDNVQKHAAVAKALRAEIADRRKTSDELAARLSASAAQLEHQEAQGKKLRARIIERADAEIQKYKRRVGALQAALARAEADKASITLERGFERANRLAAVLEASLAMTPSDPVAPGPEDTHVLQVDAVCARLDYAHQLVKLLTTTKSITALSPRPSLARGPRPLPVSTERPSVVTPASAVAAAAAVLTTITEESSSSSSAVAAAPSSSSSGLTGDGPADRLLSAVRKFYDAKNSALKGSRLSTSEVAAAMQAATDAAAVDAACASAGEGGGEGASSTAGFFSPEEHSDDSNEDFSALQPARSLTSTEQEKLFHDWCRLKGKVRQVVKQLVGTKAAVAYLRYQEEQIKVYARNRDRLLQQLISKLAGNKKAKTDLLKILVETSV